MSELYRTEYREINVNHLLKIIFKSKKIILVITLFMTVLSAYWISSLEPVYKSKSLLKIGHYSELQKNGNVVSRSFVSSAGLTIELSFLFVGMGDKKGVITKINPDRITGNYIEIESKGSTYDGSAGAIESLLSYVQNDHLKVITNNRKQLNLDLKAINDKVNTITEKQQKLLADDVVYDNQDYTSLINTIQLMSTIEIDLGVGYVGELLERREQIEFMLRGEDEKTELVGEILTSVQSLVPRAIGILLLGFFIALFLSLAIIFFREDSLMRSAKKAS